ncbi:hypothetical protein QFZ23_003791 [Arthrobacter globiformis]|uniref:hypothetical protein n=1 Tax=Arthrobacter globiformis TaxID=1665 RepID=UPI0027852FD8|nr:hypothetical protein [Arthrobacter globiformis]MDQ1059890.1 hypothetical protein [Arthrobacter globiformis]
MQESSTTCSLFVAVQIGLGLLSLDLVTAAWPVLLAMSIYVAAAVVVLLPRQGPLPLGPAITALGAVAAITLLVGSALPRDTWPGYAAWHPSASYTLLVVVNIRDRVLLSWIGVVLAAVLVTVWSEQRAKHTDYADTNSFLVLAVLHAREMTGKE